MSLSTYTLGAVSGHEWIYFIFKTNNISQKPQVINHKWVNAGGDVVPQVREKWRKKNACIYIYVWNDLAICLIPFQSNSFITPHYMTCFLINLQPSKLLLFFIPPPFLLPEYNFIISKTTWLISVVVSIIFRRFYFSLFSSPYTHARARAPETFKIHLARNTMRVATRLVLKVQSLWMIIHMTSCHK